MKLYCGMQRTYKYIVIKESSHEQPISVVRDVLHCTLTISAGIVVQTTALNGNLPPELLSHFIEHLNVLLPEASHVVLTVGTNWKTKAFDLTKATETQHSNEPTN